jgi:hypothetical protein
VSGRDFSTRPARREGALELAFLGLGVACLAAAVLLTLSARRELLEAQRGVQEIRRDPALGRQPAAGERLTTLASRALASAAAPPPRIVAELAALMPSDVRLNQASFSYGGDVSVEVAVAAREVAAYDSFLERLASSSRFSSILPGSESRRGSVSTPIHMTYRVAGAP